MSDKPILDPEAAKPGIPLKRSTLAVLLGVVLGGAVITSLIVSAAGDSAAPTAVAKDPSELRQVGKDSTIRDEESAAAARAAAARAAIPASAVPLPVGVKRDDSSSALYDNKSPPLPAARTADIEQEAAVRIAKSLVHDFEREAQKNDPATGAARAAGVSVDGTAAAQRGASEPPVPSANITAQLERLREQLQGGANQQPKPDSWLKEYAERAKESPKLLTGYSVPGKLVLRQGKVIPAVLGRQINSDLPGRITAYTATNVYDDDGRVLIPMGSTLLGEYDSGVRVGQTRLMFAFSRLILPNGFSFDLPAAPGADLAGAAGMTGDVNNHFFKMFASSLLIAFLADKTQPPQNVTNINSSGPSTAAGQVLSDVGKTILERNRTIPPTITVAQGTRINVEVVADMVFPESYRVRH